MAGKKTTEKRSFEEMLARLDEIVRRLESSDLPLEEALTLYEEGAALMKLCNDTLTEAEQKVVRLQKTADGSPRELPFDAEEA